MLVEAGDLVKGVTKCKHGGVAKHVDHSSIPVSHLGMNDAHEAVKISI